MATALNKHEDQTAALFDRNITFLMNNFSSEIEIRRRSAGANPGTNEFDDVYGNFAGDVVDPTDSFVVVTINGIITNDEFSVMDDNSVGIIGVGDIYCFTNSADVKNGDILSLVRTGSRRYKVLEKEIFGRTKQVFHRYKLSSLGD